ncbi:hypothetical protein CHLNCDRAFT_33180, partial [Chlorella variabilis]
MGVAAALDTAVARQACRNGNSRRTAQPLAPPGSRGSCQQRGTSRRAAVTAAAAGRGGGAGSSSGAGGGKGPFDGQRHGGERERNLLNAVSSSDRAGSEYGEGFFQFRLSGERTHLDVDTLNEQMQITGRQRFRHSMRPDEAFGLIFNWDNVVAETRALQRQAWQRVAEAEGLPFPSLERPQLYDVRPERAATDVLMWTRDWGRAQELAWLVASEYGRLLLDLAQPRDGVADWLQLMSKTRVPCALVTTMDRHTTGELLDKLGLRHYFTCLVTADDDMETISQRYLSAAIKLGRPPNQCVVFAACPPIHPRRAAPVMEVGQAANTTHWLGGRPSLMAADRYRCDMVSMSRLFANRGSEHMDLRNKFVGKTPPRRRLT